MAFPIRIRCRLFALVRRWPVFGEINDDFVSNHDKDDQKNDLQRRDFGALAKEPFAQAPPSGTMQPVATLGTLTGRALVRMSAMMACNISARAAFGAEVCSGRIEFAAFGAAHTVLRFGRHRVSCFGSQPIANAGSESEWRVLNKSMRLASSATVTPDNALCIQSKMRCQ